MSEELDRELTERGRILGFDYGFGATNSYSLPSIYPEEESRVLSVLQDWFLAMENDTAKLRFPDPNYKRYTEEQCTQVIDIDLDLYCEYQLLTYPTNFSGQGIDTVPDWCRLKYVQREALLQDLHRALYPRVKDEEPNKA